MFGTAAKVGLASTGIPRDEVNNIHSEEQIENVLQEMEGRSEEQITNLESDEDIENSELNENIDNSKLNEDFELEHQSNEIGNEIQVHQSTFYFILKFNSFISFKLFL